MGGLTTVFIYGLRDPHSRSFRYVGQTVDPERRLGPGDPLRGGIEQEVELVILEEVMPRRGRRLNYLFDPKVRHRLAYWRCTLTALGEPLQDAGTGGLPVVPGKESLQRLRARRPVRPRS